ncbi:MAG: DUF1330 domain-containing protein [Nannocystales bacterium]
MKHLLNSKTAALAATLSIALSACTEADDGTDLEASEPTIDEDVPGYIVVQIDSIDDPDTFFTEYANRAAPTLAKHGFVGMVASAEPNRLEGAAPDGWTVVLQFPSVDAAQGWYDDPEYVDARPFRIDSVGQTDMVLFRGLSGADEDLSSYGGYLVEQSELVHDADGFEAYLEDSAALLAGFGGSVLLEGEPVTLLEGEWPDASTRLIGFPTTDAISSWYGSDEYTGLKSQRLDASEVPSLAGFAKFCVPMGDGCE